MQCLIREVFCTTTHVQQVNQSLYIAYKSSIHDTETVYDMLAVFLSSFLQFTMASFQFYEPAPRTGHALVEYKGRTYLVGGQYYNSQPISPSSIDIFDPTTFKWQQCNTSGDIPEEVSYTAHATVGNFLYFFGGRLGEQRIGIMRVLNLESLKWSSVEPRNIPSPRSSAKMVADGVDKLLLYGGIDNRNQRLSDLHMFSIKDGE